MGVQEVYVFRAFWGSGLTEFCLAFREFSYIGLRKFRLKVLGGLGFDLA